MNHGLEICFVDASPYSLTLVIALTLTHFEVQDSLSLNFKPKFPLKCKHTFVLCVVPYLNQKALFVLYTRTFEEGP